MCRCRQSSEYSTRKPALTLLASAAVVAAMAQSASADIYELKFNGVVSLGTPVPTTKLFVTCASTILFVPSGAKITKLAGKSCSYSGRKKPDIVIASSGPGFGVGGIGCGPGGVGPSQDQVTPEMLRIAGLVAPVYENMRGQGTLNEDAAIVPLTDMDFEFSSMIGADGGDFAIASGDAIWRGVLESVKPVAEPVADKCKDPSGGGDGPANKVDQIIKDAFIGVSIGASPGMSKTPQLSDIFDGKSLTPVYGAVTEAWPGTSQQKVEAYVNTQMMMHMELQVYQNKGWIAK